MRNAICRRPIEPRNARHSRRDRASTTFTFASTGWPSAHRRKDRQGDRLFHLELLMARRPFLHRNARALPGTFRPNLDRLPQRRQVQNRQADSRGRTRPEHILNRVQSRGHSGRHGDSSARSSREIARHPKREFRNLWGKEKRAQLLDDADRKLAPEYQELHPALELGLSFQPGAVESGYLSWPLLPELFPVSFPGVKTSRDDVVVDIDKERLVSRMKQYFDDELGDAEVRAIMPTAMTSTAGSMQERHAGSLFNAASSRKILSAIVIGRSTIVGSIGSRRPSCSTRSAQNISRKCLTETSGSRRASSNRRSIRSPQVTAKLLADIIWSTGVAEFVSASILLRPNRAGAAFRETEIRPHHAKRQAIWLR